MVRNANNADVCAKASIINTPGMTGLLGKWPLKNSSLIVTFLIARMVFPDSQSNTRSTNNNG